MSKHMRPLLAFLMLAAAALACDLPIPSIPVTAPTSGGTPVPPFSPEDVGTAVAMTLTAGVPAGESSTPTVVPSAASPEGSSALLPRSFYFLASDSAGLMQVFRMEREGGSPRQVTTESVDVNDYDVSLVDGSVAYVANNQLVLVNADGSNRRMLVDGGEVDVNNPFISILSSPVFSPDGQLLAYGYKGLHIFSFASVTSELSF
jgi:hypothetical protein